MYARVVSGLLQQEKVDEAARGFQDVVVPLAKEHSGFKGALMLTDPSTGKMIALTLWETEAESKAHDIIFPEALARTGQVLAGPPTQEGYEVRVQA